MSNQLEYLDRMGAETCPQHTQYVLPCPVCAAIEYELGEDPAAMKRKCADARMVAASLVEPR